MDVLAVFPCLERLAIVAKRKKDTLKRKERCRNYRNICWMSSEGHTERDYFGMDAFKEASMRVRYPENVHPHRHDPSQVLKRFQKALRAQDFRSGDEAWILIDVDEWNRADIVDLLKWAEADSRHHVAISNPKFELFLVMHFERGKGCTTSYAVDSALKKHMPRYDKRLSRTQFRRDRILDAVRNAEMKRSGCRDSIPAAGVTDVHLLAKRLIEEGA